MSERAGYLGGAGADKLERSRAVAEDQGFRGERLELRVVEIRLRGGRRLKGQQRARSTAGVQRHRAALPTQPVVTQWRSARLRERSSAPSRNYGSPVVTAGVRWDPSRAGVFRIGNDRQTGQRQKEPLYVAALTLLTSVW